MNGETQSGYIFCTQSESFKARVAIGVSGEDVWGFAPPLWNERDYNHETESPEMVAAVKVLEHVYNGHLEKYIDEERTKVLDIDGVSVLTHVATDVMFTFQNGEVNEIHNKPDCETKEELYQEMRRILSEDLHEDSIRASFKIGVAALAIPLTKDVDIIERRLAGIAGSVEHQFTIKPFSDQELKSWIFEEKRNLDELKKTNLGIKWEDPLFLSHITSIDGLTPQDVGFGLKLSTFLHDLHGIPQNGFKPILEEVSRMSLSDEEGDLTGELDALATRVPLLQNIYIGRWGVWEERN